MSRFREALSALQRHLFGVEDSSSSTYAATVKGARKQLFTSHSDGQNSDEELCDLILFAMEQCDVYGPLRGLRRITWMCSNCEGSDLVTALLRKSQHLLDALPIWCRKAFIDGRSMTVDEIRAISEATSSMRWSTPLKKANLGSTGSDPDLRVGPRIYTEREVIRDSLTRILEGQDVDAFEASLTKIFSHLENPSNYAWTAKTVLEFYLRSCFRVNEYESRILAGRGSDSNRSSTSGSSDKSELEIAMWLAICKRLSEFNPRIWLAFVDVVVERIVECLITLDMNNAASSFLCTEFLARLLACVCFDVFPNVSWPPHSLLDTLMGCKSAPAMKLLFSTFVLTRYLKNIREEVRRHNPHCLGLVRFLVHMKRTPVTCTTQLFVSQITAPFACFEDEASSSNGSSSTSSSSTPFEHVQVSFDSTTDRIVTHPQFVACFYPLALVRPEDPLLAATVNPLSSIRDFDEQQQHHHQAAGKYWLFRTHHQLIPLIHAVARCVSANAVSLSEYKEEFKNGGRNLQVLGLLVARAGDYISRTVPSALKDLVPVACDPKAVETAERECISMAKELMENALYDMVPLKPATTATTTRRDASTNNPTATTTSKREAFLPLSPFVNIRSLQVATPAPEEALLWRIMTASDPLDVTLEREADNGCPGHILRDVLLALCDKAPHLQPQICASAAKLEGRFPAHTFALLTVMRKGSILED